MTLFKQILILVSVVLLVTLVTVLRVNFENTKALATNQSYSNAKNVANVLALLLGSNLTDEAFVRTSINAMFDGGYYQSITLRRIGGEVIYQKKEPLTVEGVPKSFFDFVLVDIPVAESQVMDGWTVFGNVQVQGHTGHAYEKLWAAFQKLCLLFTILGGGAILVSYLALKHLLLALENIQHQAEAISNNEFVITRKIPDTPELKKVVLAMNAMVEKVKTIFNRHLEDLIKFQELRDKDAVTGLYNRAHFVKHLTGLLAGDLEPVQGQILIIGLSGMEKINISEGNPIITQLYRDLARVLKKETVEFEASVVARFPRQEFAAILPDCSSEKAVAIAERAVHEFLRIIGLKLEITERINVNGGVAAYSDTDELHTVLSKVDYALSVARTNLPGTVERFREDRAPTVLGKFEWKTLIEKAFAENRFRLSAQPVLSDSGEYHREVYISLLDHQGNNYRAGFFMPMLVDLGRAARLDQYVLEHAAGYLPDHPGHVLAVNITPEFCRDRSAMLWLRQFLNAHKSAKAGLVFEMHENTLVQDPDICLDLAGMLHGLGYKFGIDQYTMNDTSLNLLRKIKPAYIKVERDYLEVFDDPGKTDMVLNALFTITDSLDIKLIATKIETDAQRRALSARNITYFQGHGIADIAPLGNSNE